HALKVRLCYSSSIVCEFHGQRGRREAHQEFPAIALGAGNLSRGSCLPADVSLVPQSEKNPALHRVFFARFLTTHRAWTSALVPLLIAAGCSDDTTAGPPSPSLTTIDVSVVTTQMEVGQETTATATGRDQYGVPVDIGPVAWTSRHPEVAVINPRTGARLAIAPGSTEITASVDGRSGQRTITVATAPAIRVNEVQPRDASNTGWVELVNTTSSAVDLAGWAL